MATKKTAVVEGFKAFDKNMQCRGFQYEVGKTYQHSGTVSLCNQGFHSCMDPLDVLNYYDIIDGIRFARVQASGKIDKRSDGDSKIASAELHIVAELQLPEYIGAVIHWITDSCKAKAGNVEGSITRGDSAKNASSGRSAKNASSGDYAKNASSGDYAKNASSGRSAKNASSGRSAKNASSGDSAKNASSGRSATNASSGHYATNASSGDSATNASSGDSATNASSGDYATNASSGDSATNASSGDYAKNEASGEHSVIAGAGRNTWAKGAKGAWISLAEYEKIGGEWRCVGFATGRAGYRKVPADTWLKAEGGKLVPE